MTNGADPNYQHPRCYAASRGGCATKISGEHFISHGLIKLYGGEGAMVTPGPAYGLKGKSIPGKIFKTNVLCVAHNSGLSNADAAALAFAKPLRAVAERFVKTGEFGSTETHTVNGEDFQRWCLKLLMTHAAAAVLSRDGAKISSPSNPSAVDLLLDRAAWPRTWGVTVGPARGNGYLEAHPFRAKALNDWWGARPFVDRAGELCGGIVELAGVSFALSLFNQGMDVGYTSHPDSPFYRTVLRPAAVSWELGDVTKTVELKWNDGHLHKSQTYGMTVAPIS